MQERFQCHTPEHLRQLCMGKGKGPQPQVGRRVRDTSEAELNGMNDLVNDNVTEVVAFLETGRRPCQESFVRNQNF